MGEGRGVYRVWEEKPEEKRQLGRPRPRWEYNIKMGLQEVGCWVWSGLVWAGSGYGHAADICECGNELSGSIQCCGFLDCLQTA
jgi:hypothetical protein